MRITWLLVIGGLLAGCDSDNGGGGVSYSAENLCNDVRRCEGGMSDEEYASCVENFRQIEQAAHERCCDQEYARMMSCVRKNYEHICEDGSYNIKNMDDVCREEGRAHKSCDNCDPENNNHDEAAPVVDGGVDAS